MKRLCLTVLYWLPRSLRPARLRWTEQDDVEWEYECWREDDYRGFGGDL